MVIFGKSREYFLETKRLFWEDLSRGIPICAKTNNKNTKVIKWYTHKKHKNTHKNKKNLNVNSVVHLLQIIVYIAPFRVILNELK